MFRLQRLRRPARRARLATRLVVAASAALGALLGRRSTAFLVAGLRLPSIVVTLATMVTLRQGLNLVRQGEFVNLPDRRSMVRPQPDRRPTGARRVVRSPSSSRSAFAMRHLAAGRFVYAVGTDAEAARLAGIRPQTRHLPRLRLYRRAHRPRPR